MIRKNTRSDLPQIHPDAFVDPTAILCGRDECQRPHIDPIVIGAHSNIQDGVVIHSKSGAAVSIGEHTSIAHRAIVHGPCTVGNGVFIGFNSVLFNCTIADGCVVRHNTAIDGCHLPADFHVPSTTRIGRSTDLATLPKVSIDASEFSEDVVPSSSSIRQRGW